MSPGRSRRRSETPSGLLSQRSDVLIPAVVGQLSTERLLVSEFVDGIKITDTEALLVAGIDTAAVARVLNDAYAEQILQLGYLHADPHPGNILVQKGPRLVLLDHGLTIELPQRLAGALRVMVRGLRDGDFAALATALYDAGIASESELDLTVLMQITSVLLGLEPVDGVTEFSQQLKTRIGELPVELMAVGRALGLLSGISRTLDPELDPLEIAATHAETHARRGRSR
jgi:ubiquinone biosynthesis protein